MTRLFGTLATSCVVLVPIAALWLMVYYALGSKPQPITEAFALLALVGLPALTIWIYRRDRRAKYD